MELINQRANTATRVEKRAIGQEIVPKDGKMAEKEIVSKERATSVTHMVIKSQIVGNFPKTRTKDPITGCQGKKRGNVASASIDDDMADEILVGNLILEN